MVDWLINVLGSLRQKRSIFHPKMAIKVTKDHHGTTSKKLCYKMYHAFMKKCMSVRLITDHICSKSRGFGHLLFFCSWQKYQLEQACPIYFD